MTCWKLRAGNSQHSRAISTFLSVTDKYMHMYIVRMHPHSEPHANIETGANEYFRVSCGKLDPPIHSRNWPFFLEVKPFVCLEAFKNMMLLQLLLCAKNKLAEIFDYKYFDEPLDDGRFVFG